MKTISGVLASLRQWRQRRRNTDRLRAYLAATSPRPKDLSR